MASHAVLLLIRQAHKLLGIAIERWDDRDGVDGQDDHDVSGVVDEDLLQLERDRDELRRRGVPL